MVCIQIRTNILSVLISVQTVCKGYQLQMTKVVTSNGPWRSQNVEKVTHIKGRLLFQAVILYYYIPFEMGTFLKGKYLLPEGANSFL